jgi:hypothetical protein
MRRLLSLAVVAVAVLALSARSAEPAPPLRALAWNIGNGGDEAKNEPSPARKLEKQRRVAEVIRASGADLVAMVETYASGEAIARELGFHFRPRGTNVSILSRWPIKDDLSVYKPFHCVGALIEAPGGRRIAFYSV